MKRSLAKTTMALGLVAILLAGLSAYATYFAFVVKRDETSLRTEYLIGVPFAVSGPLAVEATNMRDAAQLAFEEINSMLEKSGSLIRFRPIFEDTKGTPEGALATLQALYAAGVRVVVGPISSIEVRAIKSFADDRRIVVISPSATSASLALPGDYIFRTVASDLFQARALAQIVNEAGYRKVAIIGRGDDYGKGIADVFEMVFVGSYSGQVRKLLYTPGQSDYGTEVQRLGSLVRDFGADARTAVLVIAFQDDGLNIIDHSRLDPVLERVRWFGSESLKTGAFLPPKAPPWVAEFLSDVNLTGLFPTQTKTPITLAFEESYKKKFGKDPSTYTYHTYDAVWLAALAIFTASKYDPDVVRQVLPEIAERFIGASGYKKLDVNGDVEGTDYEVWRLGKKDGDYGFIRVEVRQSATFG